VLFCRFELHAQLSSELGDPWGYRPLTTYSGYAGESFFPAPWSSGAWGPGSIGNAVDSLMLKALAAAEKVSRYRHAQISAVRLAGDINATITDDASLDELLAKIKDELRKLGPLVDLEAIREPQGSRTEGGSSKSMLPASR
jgi:hypothetical protein